ncbi:MULTISPECIES: DUF1120 domain-containing protein [Pseudomonas]|jgi:type 1 fimbria pilin|uniref:DUF1120 domain-containing protein n=2 Tax=Pseudomonas veronii TaxID=76761 RepID=A0A4P7Y530_PSEVE|nr:MULTISPECIES: DUF1120 domain-containing protein [Pseudomonas]MBJ2177563.1 DUF1120 domain-containing protein [Pseudomonas veronii]MCI1738930.1 DUF1120 domain-containing protein [Pseudomonas veronii]MDY7550080.1 DUF1120 domain-containing protein [Pseudomonas sp. FG1]MEB0049668.1 DUF1120 domain-containing protein [Pseudomonas sp. FG1]NMY08689.1 DUF1120 domain-containing protein [Pseudomonas veronii]
MKKIVGLTLGLACLAAAISANASTSAELVVRGTIKPAACNLSMTGGGIINYGDIPSGQLSQTAFNPLREMTTPLSVNCGTGSAPFGLTFTDLQAGSRVTGILSALGAGYTEVHNFGLGSVAGKNTGGYAVTLRDLRSPGKTLTALTRVGEGAAWQSSDGKVAKSPNQSSWRSGTSLIPAELSQLTGTIAVRAVINKGQDLNLARDVTLDGRATLTLVYL